MKKIVAMVGVASLMVLAAFVGGCDGDRVKSEKDTGVKKVRDTKVASPLKRKKKADKRRAENVKITDSKKIKRSIGQRKNKPLPPATKENRDQTPVYTPVEKIIVDGLERALSNESLPDVKSFLKRAMESSNPDVRSTAVRALSWFGSKAMGELTKFLYDPDEGVAGDAQLAWEQALMEIEDDAMRVQYVETALTSLTNEEMLDSIAMSYHQIGDEAMVIESLVRVVESGSELGAQKAKETYEFVTGEDWVNSAAARAKAEAARKAASE